MPLIEIVQILVGEGHTFFFFYTFAVWVSLKGIEIIFAESCLLYTLSIFSIIMTALAYQADPTSVVLKVSPQKAKKVTPTNFDIAKNLDIV